MNYQTIFILKKDDKIKCLNLDEATNHMNAMQADGWKHISTIDPCLFIEHLHNEMKLNLEL